MLTFFKFSKLIIPANKFPHNFSDFFLIFKKKNIKFYNSLKLMFSVKDLFITNSAREALFLTLKSLLNEGDEIIVPAFTCNVLIGVFEKAKVKPIYADVNLDSLNMELDNIIPLINNKTRAILVTHQFGFPCNTTEIVRFFKGKNILIIEDAAAAFGARYKNELVGTLGDVGIFSLDKNKVISAIYGGIIIAKEQVFKSFYKCGIKQNKQQSSFLIFYKAIKYKLLYSQPIYSILLKIFLKFNNPLSIKKINLESSRYNIEFNSISSFQLNIANNQLRNLNQIIEKRNMVANFYYKELEFCTGIIGFPQKSTKDTLHTYSKFPVLVKNRDEFYKLALKNGLELSLTFNNKLPQFSEKVSTHLNTDFIISHIICIPISTNNKRNKECIKIFKSCLESLNTKV